MNKLFFLLPFFIMFSSCGQQKKAKNNNTTTMENYTYKTNKRTVYGMDLAIPGPHELYINDIRARKENETGMHNTFVPINPYVLKSGTYSFRLKLFPEPDDLEKGGLQPSTLQFLKVALSSYEKTGTKEQAASYKILQHYPVAKIDAPIPYYEITGEFTVELPYELEGWSNGQDLSKLDQKELQKKVVAYYEKVRTIMNNGDADTWMNIIKKRNLETDIFDYIPQNEIEEDEKTDYEGIKNENKNNMLPLEDYSLFIYADGKLVTLERNPTTKFEGHDVNIKGWNPLITNDHGAIFSSSILLYLPKGSDEFVIIRK